MLELSQLIMLLLLRGHKKRRGFQPRPRKMQKYEKTLLFLYDELFSSDNLAVDLEVAEINAFVQVSD